MKIEPLREIMGQESLHSCSRGIHLYHKGFGWVGVLDDGGCGKRQFKVGNGLLRTSLEQKTIGDE